MNTYEDIINLPHPTSPKHPRMSAIDRAAQFSPFAALTGSEAAIQETARSTDRKIELDQDAQAALDEKLRLIAEVLEDRPEVTITYFLPDKKKAGDAYVTATGRVRKIDMYEQVVIMMDGTRIPIDAIWDVDRKTFRGLNWSIKSFVFVPDGQAFCFPGW